MKESWKNLVSEKPYQPQTTLSASRPQVWQGGRGECVCVCVCVCISFLGFLLGVEYVPLKFICGILTPSVMALGDGSLGTLGEVIKLWGRCPYGEISALIRRDLGRLAENLISLPLPTMWGNNKMFFKSGRGSAPGAESEPFALGLPVSITVRDECLLLNSSCLWVFVYW